MQINLHAYDTIDCFMDSSLSGKTYTMVGTPDDPGLMVLSLNTIFDLIEKDNSSDDFEVTCSYLEVYNEVVYLLNFFEKINVDTCLIGTLLI